MVALRVMDRAWEAALVAALALLAVRIGMMIREVMGGRLPWTRVLLPGVVWIEGVGLAGQGAWQVRVVTAIALEIVFVGAAIRALRNRERSGAAVELRIARALEAVVPPSIARLAAIELTIVGLAARHLAGGWRRPVPAGFAYWRENGIRQLLPILPLLCVGDVLLLELVVLPNAASWVRVVAHVVASYGVVWLIGIYASTRARPHRFVGDRLELYRGVLGHVSIARTDVAAVSPMPVITDAWKERAYKRASVRLDLGAAHVLEVTLRDGRRLLVGVDQPETMTAAIAQWRTA